MTRERSHRRNAPTLVGVAVFGSSSDRKGKHLVEKEIQAVIVIDEHDDIRPDLRQPLADRRETVEERFPVGIVLQTLGDRAADRGHMRGGDGADDLRHDLSRCCP